MLLRFIAVAGALLMLAACGSTPEPAGGPGGPTGPGGISGSRFGPGSQQDLAATAGDRIFFAYDSAAAGIPGSRISTISYGKERPEIPHSDDQSYAQNRRGVTTVN